MFLTTKPVTPPQSYTLKEHPTPPNVKPSGTPHKVTPSSSEPPLYANQRAIDKFLLENFNVLYIFKNKLKQNSCLTLS